MYLYIYICMYLYIYIYILSRSKTEYLHYCFSGRVDVGGEVTLDGRPITKVNKFKYLSSTIQQNGDIDEDINHQIKVG